MGTNVSSSGNSDICAVCMDNINSTRLLPCNHSLCYQCSTHKALRNRCPLCRRKIRKRQELQVHSAAKSSEIIKEDIPSRDQKRNIRQANAYTNFLEAHKKQREQERTRASSLQRKRVILHLGHIWSF